MKFLQVFLFLSIFIFGCRPAKKVQKIQEAISKVDTTSIVVMSENKADTKTVNATTGKDIFAKVISNKIDFNYFNGKVRIEYEGKEGGDEATAFIRLKKDSAMWLSLRGALGIEGFRVLITRDSVKVMNLLKKNVQYRSISYLQEVTGIPFDFATMQDMVVGNPVFIDSNVISYKVNANNEMLVLMSGSIFKNLITLDNTDFKILHSKLDDIDIARNRTCDITFGNYQNAGGILFSTSRKILLAERSKLDISLDFKQYSFNQPISFPFNIPKNYKRL
ncbi:MAG: DUF4292 domain-containing protein [Bacteroidota bacterium]|nr:DUF4292 domain-containing protein [Bacteroidota bacterium]